MPKGIPKSGINKGWIRKGQKLSKITRNRISKSLIGNTRATGGPGGSGHLQTNKTRKKISKNLSIAKIGVPQFHMRGDKNSKWKGGITPVNKQIRQSIEYKNWRRECFKRDNFTCQKCGGKGIFLEVHHIKPFAEFPKLRFIVGNGVTLCVGCHEKIDFHKRRFKVRGGP